MANWRDVLPVHPAADLFPMMSDTELRELGNDIKNNGLQSPIIIHNGELLDGRNRLEAMELVGLSTVKDDKLNVACDNPKRLGVGPYANDFMKDPYAYVLSANIHRRHLTNEQKRDLIENLLKAKPEASDRQIAKQTNSSPTTVGSARKSMEKAGDVSKLDTRTESNGRKQPATKPKKATAKLNRQDVDVSKLGPKAQEAIEKAVASEPTDKRQAVFLSGSISEQLAVVDDGPAKALSDSELAANDSANALGSFKEACDRLLPKLNKEDAAKARVYFNNWTAKLVKAAKEAAAV